MNLPSWRPLACTLACTLAWPAQAEPPAAAVSASTAAAAAIGPLTKETLDRAVALASGAAAALAPAGARVQVQPGSLDPRLTLAPCSRVEAYLGKGLPAWGRTRVGLRCDDGAVRWNVFLPLTVQVWAPALVSTTTLPAGARLTESQLTVADADWASTPQQLFADAQALAGRTLVRPLAAGQPVRPTDLQPRLWFAIGDRVRVVVSGKGYSVHAEGHALSPGLEGLPVRVRVGEEGSRRVAVGRAVAADLVEIDF